METVITVVLGLAFALGIIFFAKRKLRRFAGREECECDGRRTCGGTCSCCSCGASKPRHWELPKA